MGGLSLIAFGVLLTGSPRAVANRPLRFLGRYSYGIDIRHDALHPALDRLIPAAALAACGSPLPAAARSRP